MKEMASSEKKANLQTADATEGRRQGGQGEGRGAPGRRDPDRARVRPGLADAARRPRARSRSRRSPPGRCRSTSRSASAACRAAGSSRSSAPSPRARRRSSTTSSPRPRRAAGSAPSSTPSTRSTRSTRKRIGVDTDELLVSQPDYGEQALEIVDVLVRSGAVDVVAIDSVAALTPRVELEGQMGETQVGLQARLMSQALRKLAGNLNRANTVCLFTNQIREKIGVRFGSPGDPAGRPGAEVLLLAAPRHPPHRDPQGGHRGGRQPGPGEGRQEQGRGAVPPGRVRHRVRRRDLERGLPARPRRSSTTWSRSRARSSPTASCGSARGATTPSSSWPRTRRPPARSRRSCSRPSGSSGPPPPARRRPRRQPPIEDAAAEPEAEEPSGRPRSRGGADGRSADAFEARARRARPQGADRAELAAVAAGPRVRRRTRSRRRSSA